MRKLLTVLVAVTGLCGGVVSALAQAAHTPDQAKAFVEKAVTFLKAEGKDKALAAFSDPKGAWVDGDLYLVVLDGKDAQLTMLAHGVNKALIGKAQIDVKDAEGKAFNKDVVATLATANDVWVSYKWPNPATKKIAVKKTYYVKSGDMFVGAGVYE
jgi:cytochrome c